MILDAVGCIFLDSCARLVVGVVRLGQREPAEGSSNLTFALHCAGLLSRYVEEIVVCDLADPYGDVWPGPWTCWHDTEHSPR